MDDGEEVQHVLDVKPHLFQGECSRSRELMLELGKKDGVLLQASSHSCAKCVKDQAVLDVRVLLNEGIDGGIIMGEREDPFG